MDITPRVPAGRQLVHGYGDGGFRVSGIRYEGSVLIFPSRVMAWPVASVSDLTPDWAGPVVNAGDRVEILLLGCGARMVPIGPELRQELRTARIVLEVMDTGAACRTYNVLLAEERRVAAAVIAVA